MSQYFDLHLHPSFKPFLSDEKPDHKKHCWNTFPNILGIVSSQASLPQMKFGKVNLAVSAIYAMEKAMTTSVLIKYVAPKITILDQEMIKSVQHREYFELLSGEIDHLTNSMELDAASGKSFNFINKVSEIEPDKLNLILAIEGAHGLRGKDDSTILPNLKKLKKSQHNFLYLTFTHMTQFPLCTHAFGMKLIKNNDDFKPKGFGITDLGKQVIDTAYDSTIGHRILIDIKHMSIRSRKDFYAYRHQKGYGNIPIMATHMGFTGISWKKESIERVLRNKVQTKDRGFVEVEYKRPRGIGEKKWPLGKGITHFNPWSLNLYNEEIPLIVESGGLIGLSMDQRIIGTAKVKGEYYDENEWKDLMEEKVELKQGEFKDEPLTRHEIKRMKAEADELQEKELSVFNRRKHLRHLANTILHVVRHGGEKAWDHMCIGSDFDGLIDPVNSCRNASQYDKLEEDLLEHLHDMIEEAGKKWATIDFKAGDLKVRIRNIMFDNAVNFLTKHF